MISILREIRHKFFFDTKFFLLSLLLLLGHQLRAEQDWVQTCYQLLLNLFVLRIVVLRIASLSTRGRALLEG